MILVEEDRKAEYLAKDDHLQNYLPDEAGKENRKKIGTLQDFRLELLDGDCTSGPSLFSFTDGSTPEQRYKDDKPYTKQEIAKMYLYYGITAANLYATRKPKDEPKEKLKSRL